jgi:uncharacterized protein YutE (UPF0331/DUF86 family)
MTIKLGKGCVNLQTLLPRVAETVEGWKELVALWLFGSYAEQVATPLSDLDFAYLLQDGLPTTHVRRVDTGLYVTLARLFGTDDLTLVNLRGVPPKLAFAVLKHGQLLFCRDAEQRACLQEDVARHFPDTERLTKETLCAFEQGLKGAKMAVDKARLLSQLRLLQDDLEKLQEKAAMPREAYLTDVDTRSVVERRFQTAMESCINIGNHLISRLNLPLADDYASVFRSLSEGHIISAPLAEAMADMARFRNLLVHLYWTVDHQLVYDTMAERIATLHRFMREIAAYLTTLTPGEGRDM